MAKFFSHIFANTGDKTAVSDIADPSGTVSYEVGYPSAYSTVGGKNPERTKLNQILNDITGAIQYLQVEGYMAYQSGYAYDIGATVRFTDNINYVNTIAGNTNAPNVSGWNKVLDSSFIDNATSKTTPVDADELPLADSAASFGLKKLTWANLKATLNTYLASIYAPIASPHFTGTPSLPTGTTAVTQTAGDNSTKLATTAFTLANQTPSIGVGQSWQGMTASRALGTTYTNTTGKPIMVLVTSPNSNSAGGWTITVNGVSISSSGAIYESLTTPFIVPNGFTYVVTSVLGVATWAELR